MRCCSATCAGIVFALRLRYSFVAIGRDSAHLVFGECASFVMKPTSIKQCPISSSGSSSVNDGCQPNGPLRGRWLSDSGRSRHDHRGDSDEWVPTLSK
jgi:3-oxoacyl-[acyl-carrier-protein] synthase III